MFIEDRGDGTSASEGSKPNHYFVLITTSGTGYEYIVRNIGYGVGISVAISNNQYYIFMKHWWKIQNPLKNSRKYDSYVYVQVW